MWAIEFLRKCCVYDEIFDKYFICLEKVIKFERLKILCADKTGFHRLLVIYIVNKLKEGSDHREVFHLCHDTHAGTIR